MPFGIGLHVIIAIFFAVHVVRTGRELYWLFILFFFPLLGSIVYLFAVFLPEMQSARTMKTGLQKVASAAVSVIDPGRELREAKDAFEFTPTAQNQWRYADALLAADKVDEAVAQFEQCLKGPFANDLEIQFAAANAYLRAGQTDNAMNLLLSIRKASASFREEAITMSLARLYVKLGKNSEAKQEFEHAVTRFGSVDSRAEYAIWAAQQGDLATARHLYDELTQVKKYWNSTTRDQYAEVMSRLDSAMKQIQAST